MTPFPTLASILDNQAGLLMVVAGTLVLFGFIVFLAKRYKRCPSQPDPRDLRQGGHGASRRSASTAAARSCGR